MRNFLSSIVKFLMYKKSADEVLKKSSSSVPPPVITPPQVPSLPQTQPQPYTPTSSFTSQETGLWKVYELILMALCVWREARGEPRLGKVWVAWVIKNRKIVKGWWNRSGMLSEVLLKPQQFSSLTDKNDKQLTVFPYPVKHGEEEYAPDKEFSEILVICEEVLRTPIAEDPTRRSDHYYSASMIDPPSWADEDKLTGIVGRHKFYRLLT